MDGVSSKKCCFFEKRSERAPGGPAGAILPPGRKQQGDQYGREVILQFGAHQAERPADFEIDMADGNSQFGGDLAVCHIPDPAQQEYVAGHFRHLADGLFQDGADLLGKEQVGIGMPTASARRHAAGASASNACPVPPCGGGFER